MPYANPPTPLATDRPPPETRDGQAGTTADAARGDHTHPRLTSATIEVLNNAGEATVTFTRTFTAMPAVTCLLYEEADNQPIVYKVKSWVRNQSGAYTGCVIKGYRARPLPEMGLLTLLSALVSALTNFNVFGGSAAGAQFCCIALQPSN